MTTLQHEIDRWQTELNRIAETCCTDHWFLEERRLAEAQHTIIAFRGHILPLLAGAPRDVIVADEIEHLVDHLEDLRNDLFRTLHPGTAQQEIAETLAALRTLSNVALRYERTLDDLPQTG